MISRGERANKTYAHSGHRHRSVSLRLVLGAFIVVIIAIGGSHAMSAYLLLEGEQQQSFASKNSSAVSSILSQLNNYNDLLYIGLGYLQNTQTTTQQEWDGFFRTQNVFTRYAGVSAIYFVQVLDDDNRDTVIEAVRSQLDDQSLAIHPASSYGTQAVVTLLSSDNSIPNPFLFDTYADPARRSVYEEAALKHKTTTSPVIRLTDGQDGMYITSPIYKSGTISGYVSVSFRIKQLMDSIIPNESELYFKITDTTPDDNGDDILYESDGWGELSKRQTAAIYTTVGSRVWKIETAATEHLRQTSPYLVPISGATITLVFAVVTVFVGRYYIRRIERTPLGKD